MTPVLADVTGPIPSILGDSGHPTCVLLSPVFVEGGARRRRLLARWGYLAAAASLAYLAMLGVSFTASPVAPTARPRRDNDTRPTTRSLTISTTPVPSSKTASPTSTPKRAAS